MDAHHLLQLMLLLVPAEYEIFTQRYSADPSPFVTRGRVYITTSHDRANATAWSMRDYNCLSSDDMVNWRDEGIVFSMDSVGWADSAWAQQVVQLPNGTFLMAFPGMGRRKPPGCNASWCHWSYPGGVGIASSQDPAGPFVDQLGFPIMPGDDPTLFVDPESEEVHLCSNLNGPNCGILATDMKSWRVPAPGLPTWPQGSQSIPGSNFTKAAWHWYEAPWIYRIGTEGGGSIYYLSFMMDQKSCKGSLTTINNVSCPTGACAPLNCSHAHYGSDLGYAVSAVSPIANYTFKGSFMWAPPFNCGLCNLQNESAALCNHTGGDNAHHGMVEFPPGSGKHWIAYHTRKLGAERGQYRGYQRNVGFDRLYVNKTDHSLLPVTATPHWLRPVKYLDPYTQTPAFTMAGASAGIDTERCNDSQRSLGAKALNIGHTYDGASIFVRHVDFGFAPGATSVQLRVATAETATSIEILSGSAAHSRLLAKCAMPGAGSGGWQNWTTVKCPIPGGATGIHNTIRFVFRCTSCTTGAGVVNFNWWRFVGGQVSGKRPPPTTVSVRIRARGAGRQYLVLSPPENNSGVRFVVTTANGSASAATFHLIDNDNGSWSIGVRANRRGEDLSLLCVQFGGALVAAEPLHSTALCTRFRLQPTLDGSWSLRSYANAQNWLLTEVSATNEGPQLVAAAATDPRGLLNDAARFELEEIDEI